MKKYVYSEAKEVVVCGDNYYTTLYNWLAGRLSKANNWVVFVRGNHDDPLISLYSARPFTVSRCF